MKVFLDSAQAQAWSLPAGCPPVAGVTTNPSLIYQAGLPVSLPTYLSLIQAAADHGMAELMLQLPSANAGLALQWLGPLQSAAAKAQVVLTVKLPCQADWLPCIQAVRQTRQAILLTGLSNAVQLLWARSLNAAYVAPYVGRIAADGRDVWALMQACVAVQNAQPEAGPALLAASIKSPEVLARLLGLGAKAVTVSPASMVAWSQDELTHNAIAQFERDVAESQSLA